MGDWDNLKRALDAAETTSGRMRQIFDRLQDELRMGPELYDCREAEQALEYALRTVAALTDVLAESYSLFPDRASRAYDPENVWCTDVVFESAHMIRCVLPEMPVTKRHAAAMEFTGLYREALARKIIQGLPNGFRPYRQAYVIYVHHALAGSGKKPDYYDNDNLAIKALLDTVLPLVCVDDAACICDNLYFYISGVRRQTALWVVDKSHLADWAAMHPEMPVLQDLQPYFI